MEEGGVDDQVRHAAPQGVPLVVGGQVDRRREEGEAGSGEENQAEPYQPVGSKYLNWDFTLCQA